MQFMRCKAGNLNMLEIFENLRDITLLTICIRVLLAVFCGGVIGFERECHRQPAGLRTHMLICLGSAITIMTSQHIIINMHLFTDVGRMGAQVVAGIGFIGTGAIVKTKGKIRGLTTAAGLWTAAIIGLAIGIGFYEAGLIVTLLVLIAEGVLPKFEQYISGMPEINLYMEYIGSDCYIEIMDYIRCRNFKILDREVTRVKSNEKHNACAIFMLRLNKGYTSELVRTEIKTIPGVVRCEII